MPIEKTGYLCAHCKKVFRVKLSAIIEHESWCYANPDNQNMCTGCNHYVKPSVTRESPYDEGWFRSHFCKKRKLYMLSPKMKAKARKGKKFWLDEDDVGTDRCKNEGNHVRCVMPQRCRYHE